MIPPILINRAAGVRTCGPGQFGLHQERMTTTLPYSATEGDTVTFPTANLQPIAAQDVARRAAPLHHRDRRVDIHLRPGQEDALPDPDGSWNL